MTKRASYNGKLKFKDNKEFFVAYLANNITMQANPTSSKITVCWGERTELAPSMYGGKHKATFDAEGVKS
jgi:hypothetical protein